MNRFFITLYFGIFIWNLKSYFILPIIGFGVCCIKILSDEGSTSLNQSYIVQASSTSLGVGSRQYTVCPCSVDVCRIRFDFTVSKYFHTRFITHLLYKCFCLILINVIYHQYQRCSIWLPHIPLQLEPLHQLQHKVLKKYL